MSQLQLDLANATFVGIDSHPSEHTALAINRFEEEKGTLRFENTQKGIRECRVWLGRLTPEKSQIIIGIEGGETRHTFASYLLDHYSHVYEVNPLFTKQRRMLGTRTGKSDPADAKLIAEVLTRKLSLLPKFHKREFSTERFCLRKTVKFYEETTVQGARLKNRLRQLDREYALVRTKEERAILRLIRQEKRTDLQRVKLLQKRLTNELSVLLVTQGKNLTTIKGVSTILAARIVAHANGIDRFPTVAKFIRYAGIAPVERSSGKKKRFLRDMRNNRQLNTAIYMLAFNQLRWNAKAKEYVNKKVAEGKTSLIVSMNLPLGSSLVHSLWGSRGPSTGGHANLAGAHDQEFAAAKLSGVFLQHGPEAFDLGLQEMAGNRHRRCYSGFELVAPLSDTG